MQVQRTSYCLEVIHSSENAAAQISTSVQTFSVVSGVRPAPSGRRVAWEPIAGAFPIQRLVLSCSTLAGRLLLWGLDVKKRKVRVHKSTLRAMDMWRAFKKSKMVMQHGKFVCGQWRPERTGKRTGLDRHRGVCQSASFSLSVTSRSYPVTSMTNRPPPSPKKVT